MTFRSKILFLYVAVVVVCTAGVLFWMKHRWEEHRLETTRASLEYQARVLAGLLDPSHPRLDEQVDRAARDTPYRITVIDPSGTVVADSSFSGPALYSLENHLSRSEVVQAGREGAGSSFRYSTSVRTWLFYVALRFPGREGYLRLALPLDEDTFFADLATGPATLVVACSILAITLGLMVFRRVDSGVRTLTRTAQEMAKGKFAGGIPLYSRHELGSLARSLEETSSALEARFQGLQSETNHLTTIVNSMTEGVLVTDERGRIVRTNPAFHEILGFESNPAGRMPLEVLRNPEIQEGIEKVLAEQRHAQLKIQIGSKVVLARLAPIVSEASASRGVVVVFHDITELERLENVRKEFISNVSHELKTPLTSIKGFAETLLSENSTTEPQRRFLEKIYRNSEELTKIIESLFKLSSLESRPEPLERQKVNFGQLMEELRRDFEPRLQTQGVRLVVDNRLGDKLFPAGKAYIERVFYNLIENALGYSGSEEIQVQAQFSGEEFIFTVRDFGIGIPPGDLDRIFERFYRVHKDRSRKTGGAGIGLALVKHIVRLHGGRIWAESSPGSGTAFCFTLPEE